MVLLRGLLFVSSILIFYVCEIIIIPLLFGAIEVCYSVMVASTQASHSGNCCFPIPLPLALRPHSSVPRCYFADVSIHVRQVFQIVILRYRRSWLLSVGTYDTGQQQNRRLTQNRHLT